MISRRRLLTGAAVLAVTRPALAQTEAAYFDGFALDHGVQFRRTKMALIPPEFRRQVTRDIEDPEPGRIVVDTRDHFLWLTNHPVPSLSLLTPRAARRRPAPPGDGARPGEAPLAEESGPDATRPGVKVRLAG